MKHRPRNRENLPKRKKRALKELQDAEDALFESDLCQGIPEGHEPSLSEMLEIGECQLPDR